MYHLFIADLHISSESLARNTAFLHFLEEEASRATSLFILGDLFDFWVGDDDLSLFHLSIITALKNLSEKGVQCYLMSGNRDFLLGRKFSQLSGVQLLSQPYLLQLSQQRCLLMHGDLLCTDDKSYQRFRRIMHCKPLQRLFLCLPLCWRRKIGERIRHGSKVANSQKEQYLLDVSMPTIENYINQYKADYLIHGHTHRALQQTLSSQEGKTFQRIVLGSWEQQGWVLKVTESGEFTLRDFVIEGE